jgi:hypothetical protein
LFRTIGASYIIRQIPHSERTGGLQVTLRPLEIMPDQQHERGGKFNVELTDWKTGKFIDSEGLRECAKIAEEAVRRCAKHHGVDLRLFDVTLSKFLYHEVDSSPICYAQTGACAFRSAYFSLEAKRWEEIAW